jgi:hypothetical protein
MDDGIGGDLPFDDEVIAPNQLMPQVVISSA